MTLEKQLSANVELHFILNLWLNEPRQSLELAHSGLQLNGVRTLGSDGAVGEKSIPT